MLPLFECAYRDMYVIVTGSKTGATFLYLREAARDRRVRYFLSCRKRS